MRSFLFVMLVACGGGTQSSPPPASNQPPATSPSQPMVAETSKTPPALCTESDLNNCVIATLDYYSKQMCACKDKACADGLNEGLTKWGTEMAKLPAAKQKSDPEVAKHATDIMTRYAECMTKLMMDGMTPPPDPCGGGDNPCG